MSTVLQLSAIGCRFGEIRAVDDVSLEIADGARHALIGPNGAGKTTLFNVIAGSIAPTAGTIQFAGEDITKSTEYARAIKGVARTFQHSQLFLRETVLENVLLATMRQQRKSWNMFRPVTSYRKLRAQAFELLERIDLAARAHDLVAVLSHGERRQVEVALALATEPRLLLLDEPAAGMSQAETESFIELIEGLPRSVTVLLIEHDLDLVLGFADTVTMLHLGQHLVTGTPAEVQASSAAQEAYLGAADGSGEPNQPSRWSALHSSDGFA